MKQLEKQSLKELIKYALGMPAPDLAQYLIFSNGPLPDQMTRGELIALQLLDRACKGELDAVKELRQWVQEDPKDPATAGGTNYYQFLINLAGGPPAESPEPAAQVAPETAKNLKKLAKAIIEIEATPAPPPRSPLLDDLG